MLRLSCASATVARGTDRERHRSSHSRWRGCHVGAHSRTASANLPGTRIRIPSRPPVSLVDLSSGGALIELPFPLVPQSRVIVELHTLLEQVAVPLQLLRCYVAKLEGGVRYHAAGAFDQLIKLPSISAGPSARERLIGTLERLLRAGQEAGHARRAAG